MTGRRLVTLQTERAASRWHFLQAVEELGEAGPLGDLRRLLPRGPWPAPERGSVRHDPAEVARLRPGAAAAYAWAADRGLFDGLPAGSSPLQAANLARWARRWHLAAPWALRQAAATLWLWTAAPELADSCTWGASVAVGYWSGTSAPKRVLPLAWDHATESRADAEARIAAELAAWLDARASVAAAAGWHAAPERRTRGARAPGWELAALARYQCGRVSQRKLARELSLSRQAVARALEKAAESLPLPLRRP